MERIFVSKDVAYAAKVGGGTIANTKEVNSLAPGALAFLTEKGEVITQANAATVLPDVKNVMMLVGRDDENQVLNQVPRFIEGITRANYRAATKVVITVGGTTAAKSLTFVDGEDASIRVTDISYTSRYAPRSKGANVYKRSSVTIEAAVDKLVAALNANSFVTATKTGSGSDFGIAITPKDDNVMIEVSMDGSLADGNIERTTDPVYAIGRGVDILQMEKDASATDEGNGNYIEYTAEWYKRNMVADVASNYDVINISWGGAHRSPSHVRSVMHNNLSIACVNGVADGTPLGAAQSANDVMALLALIFPSAYSGATAAETGADDGTDTDGVSGN